MYYNIMGGGLEKDEQIKFAVKREVSEECGLNVQVNDVVFVLEYEPKSTDYIHGEKYQFTCFFDCSVIGSVDLQMPVLPDINPEDESITVQPEWVSTEKLKTINLVPKVNDKLIAYIKNRDFKPTFLSSLDI